MKLPTSSDSDIVTLANIISYIGNRVCIVGHFFRPIFSLPCSVIKGILFSGERVPPAKILLYSWRVLHKNLSWGKNSTWKKWVGRIILKVDTLPPRCCCIMLSFSKCFSPQLSSSPKTRSWACLWEELNFWEKNSTAWVEIFPQVEVFPVSTA